MSPTAGETHQGPEADHTPSHPGPRRCRRSITPHEVGRDLGAAWGRLPTVSRVIRLVPPHTGHSLVEAHGLGTGDGPEETIFHSNRRVWSKTWPAMVQGFYERTRNKSSDDGADLAAQVRTLTRQSGPPHYPLSAQVANRKPRPTQEPGTDACKTGTAAGTRECFFRGTVLGSEPGPRPQPPAVSLLLKQFREPTTPESSNQSLAPKHNLEAKLTSQAACSSQLPSLWQAQHLTTPLCDQTAPPSSHVALPYGNKSPIDVEPVRR
jgi:hypothetical protein